MQFLRAFGTCFAWNGVHGILLLSYSHCVHACTMSSHDDWYWYSAEKHSAPLPRASPPHKLRAPPPRELRAPPSHKLRASPSPRPRAPPSPRLIASPSHQPRALLSAAFSLANKISDGSAAPRLDSRSPPRTDELSDPQAGHRHASSIRKTVSDLRVASASLLDLETKDRELV